jgi:phosphoglucomutase
VAVKEVETKPYDGQKTGTSGLRKKTKEFMKVRACCGLVLLLRCGRVLFACCVRSNP